MSDLTPELNNGEEIDRLLGSDLQAKREAGIGKALQNVTLGIVNGRHALSGLRQSLGTATTQLEQLNNNIKTADTSSQALTTAIKNITIAGTIIAGIGLLVAIANLVFEVYKYVHPVVH
jgi:hypothetical protein